MSEPADKTCANCIRYSQEPGIQAPDATPNEGRCTANPPTYTKDQGRRGWAYASVLGAYPACRHHSPRPAPPDRDLFKHPDAVYHIGFDLKGTAREYSHVFLMANVGRGIHKRQSSMVFIEDKQGGRGPVPAWQQALEWFCQEVPHACPEKLDMTDSVEEFLQQQRHSLCLLKPAEGYPTLTFAPLPQR